jgi:hypothetical protein
VIFVAASSSLGIYGRENKGYVSKMACKDHFTEVLTTSFMGIISGLVVNKVHSQH